MIIAKNTILPLKGYAAMTIYPFVFVRKGKDITDRIIRHEAIHCEQQKELFVVGIILALLSCYWLCWWSLLFVPIFFWWYCIEWLVRLLIYRNADKAYSSICFEKEAYGNQDDADYLKTRKLFAFKGIGQGDS